MAGFVDDEGGSLSFLLGDLLGFDGGGKFRREGEVLQDIVSKMEIGRREEYGRGLRSTRHRQA